MVLKDRSQEDENLLREVHTLLSEAGQSWVTVTGEFTLYESEDWSEAADQDRADDDHEALLTKSEGTEEASSLLRWSFWATSRPFGLRMELLDVGTSDQSNENQPPAVVVVNESLHRWWMAHRNEVQSYSVPPDVIATVGQLRFGVYAEDIVAPIEYTVATPPLESLDLLLRPTSVLECFDLHSASIVAIAGRSTLRVQATATPFRDALKAETDPMQRLPAATRLAVPEVTGYDFLVDREYGIVVGMDAHINGLSVERRFLQHLAFDGELEVSLFAGIE